MLQKTVIKFKNEAVFNRHLYEITRHLKAHLLFAQLCTYVLGRISINKKRLLLLAALIGSIVA
ncbi:hypothetical protein PL18_08560 [Vibrio renipiscarius]|uniref:Uncharacterized protein n=1 Tax=Vibrio renipiscarius TaxID=1461322 RepID=A0A0C2JNQ5_9VIBR|nr:hypothetical protein PL18_08560 [Vibrio renipiscarius]KII80679.1 hypothetical protein OJ16_05105 [Vibrio renipiscarius]